MNPEQDVSRAHRHADEYQARDDVLVITKGKPWRISRERQDEWSTPMFLKDHAEPVVQLGEDKVLRRRAMKPSLPPKGLEELAASLFASMVDAGGVGIAAPQIGVPLRVIVLNAARMGIVAVDPKVTFESKDKDKIFEACLSLRGYQGKILRPTKARLNAMDIRGRKFTAEGTGVGAQLIVHEVDHLQGHLYVDRLDSLEDLFTFRYDEDEDEDVPISQRDKQRLLRALES